MGEWAVSWQEFHFLRPWWWLALLPLGWLGYLLHTRHFAGTQWEAICDKALLPHILTGRPERLRRWGTWLFLICGLLLTAALSGPTWQRLPQPVFRADSGLVVALDLSLTMDAADVSPSRLQAAVYKIRDLLEDRKEGQTALLVYAGEPFTVVPLSDDTRTVLSQLSAMRTDLLQAGDKDTAAALEHAHQLLRQSDRSRGHVLLVTDGLGKRPPGPAIDALAGDGYRLSVLAVGTREGAPVNLRQGGFLKDAQGAILVSELDEQGLRSAALRGGGRYVPLAWSDEDVRSLLAFFADDRELQEMSERQQQADHWRDEGVWLLFLVLPFALAVFRRGAFLAAVLWIPLMWAAPEPASAADWREVWLNSDQRGHRLLEDGDADGAAETFEDPVWQAAAWYQAGKYQEALDAAPTPKTAEEWYNQGNVLARLGRYQDALDAYQEAMRMQEGHEDAEHNHRIVAEALRKQQEAAQGEQGDQGGDQGGQQGDQGQQGEQGGDQSSAGSQGQQGQQQSGQQAGESGERMGMMQEDGEQAGAQGAGEDGQEGEDKAYAMGQEGEEGKDGEEEDEAFAMGQEGEEGKDGEEGEDGSQRRILSQQDGDEELRQQDGDSDSGWMTPQEGEKMQATEQWLRRIPDEPGELLRRKFQYQQQLRRRK